jgi:TRAP-type mannitol/chloroaromatic compound transport system permease large subunit
VQDLIAPAMFASMVIFLLFGYPVAFSLAANGLLFAFIGIELGMMEPALLQALPDRVYAVISNETLLAIPFFTYMGLILERSGMAEDLLNTIGQLFGPVRGGLAYAVIFVGALLAATTGVVAASVISMGLISLPVMMRYGYDNRLSAGVIAASGTLAQIIPPSLVLIVLADQMSVSVGDMYKGAFVPGLALAAMYAAFVFAKSIAAPASCPALPPQARVLKEPNGDSGIPSLLTLLTLCIVAAVCFAHFYFEPDEATDRIIVMSTLVGTGVALLIAGLNRVLRLGWLSGVTEKVVFVMIPPLALIFLTLGTIFIKLATPTEAGAMGATGALLMALAKGRLSWKLNSQALEATARLTTFVMFILIGARVFSLTFYGVDGQIWVEHLLGDLPGGQVGFLIVVNIMVFLIAFFLDFFEIAFIMVPLLMPVALKLGIDPIWFGVMLGVNMQTSFMHPPFGFSLFYLRSVAPPAIKTSEIYWGAIPFVIIQILMVTLIILFPELVTTAPAGIDQTIIPDIPFTDYSSPSE